MRRIYRASALMLAGLLAMPHPVFAGKYLALFLGGDALEVDTSAFGASKVLQYNATTGKIEFATSGSGDVTGPGSSTDNAVVRFDGTGGKTLQDSGVTISDGDIVTGVAFDATDGVTAARLTQDTASAEADAINLTSEARGDVLYRNATGWVRLAAGTSGNFLQTLGAGADPAWAAGFTGDLDSATNKYLDNSGSSYGGAVAIRDSAGLVVSNGSETQSLTITADPLGAITLNASSGYFDVQDAVGITGNTSVTGVFTVRDATNGNGLVIDRAGANDVVTITGGTLAAGKSAIEATATLNQAGGTEVAYDYTMTPSGGGSSNNYAMRITGDAGVSTSGFSAGITVFNSGVSSGVGALAASSGTHGLYAAGQLNTGSGDNVGAHGIGNGTATGRSFGIIGTGGNGAGPANSIGVFGRANNGSSTRTGGFFTLGANTTPTFQTAALIADNFTVAADIVVVRDNGTEVLVVEDGGVFVSLPGGTKFFEVNATTVDVTNTALRLEASGAGQFTGSAVTGQITIPVTMPDATYMVSVIPISDGQTPSFQVGLRTTTTFNVTASSNSDTLDFVWSATDY